VPNQILTQTGQQLLGGEEAAMEQHVWLAILRHALAGAWLGGQDIALDDRGPGTAGGRGRRSKQPCQAASDHDDITTSNRHNGAPFQRHCAPFKSSRRSEFAGAPSLAHSASALL
jgi:hypothetical protein